MTTTRILGLSRGILHYILQEWLEWKDISQWDLACLGSCRGEWLAVLDGLIVPCLPLSHNKKEEEDGGPKKKAKEEYSWTLQRKIFPREYPLSLSKLDTALNTIENLQDERAFSTIRSVAICRTLSFFRNINHAEDWEVKVCKFLSRCLNMEGLRLTTFTPSHELVQLLLNDHVPPLKTVELIHCDLLLTNFHHLLSKHVATLKQLAIIGKCFSVDRLVEFLHRHSVGLTSLHIQSNDSLGPTEELLLAYLSANGKDLKSLAIDNSFVMKKGTHRVLVSILKCCPHLECLTFTLDPEEEVESIRCHELYQAASSLRDISCDRFTIHVNEKKCIVSFEGVYSENGDHTKSLLHVLKEGYLLEMKGEQATVPGNELKNIVEKLGPYLVSFDDFAVEMNDDLVEKMMETCPRLHTLVICLIEGSFLTDRALQAIASHGSTIQVLEFLDETCLWSDEAVTNMIRSCSSLVSLNIPFVGCQAVKALASLPKLQNFTLISPNWNVDEVLQAFFEEKVRWSNTFRHGSVFMFVEGHQEMGGLNIFAPDYRSPFDLECYRLNSMDDNVVVYLSVQEVAAEWFTLPTERMIVFEDEDDDEEEEEEEEEDEEEEEEEDEEEEEEEEDEEEEEEV